MRLPANRATMWALRLLALLCGWLLLVPGVVLAPVAWLLASAVDELDAAMGYTARVAQVCGEWLRQRKERP